MSDSSQYPSGLFPEQMREDPPQSTSPGDDPSWISGPVLEMSKNWGPIEAMLGGTDYLRRNCTFFLPKNPKEDEDAYRRRVAHAVVSPFTVRLAEQAVGLVLRKPIQLNDDGEGADVDPFWEEFCKDVDGQGTDLDEFARKLAFSALLYGHAGTMVDYPATEPAPNLQVERELGLRPYFIEVSAKQILGWRRTEDNPLAPLGQVRIDEWVQVPLGEFGDQTVRQIRILENDRYRVYRRDGDGTQTSNWYVCEEGPNSIGQIPLSITYSAKVGELISKPPLLPIANLNILHTVRQCDLNHALTVAALPVLVLQGFDDTDNEIGLSANSAILLPPEGSASYVEPVGQGSFDAQAAFIKELEGQMSNLGISTIFSQLNQPETAESKKLSRTDSDSLLAILSKNLEASLQEAFNLAAKYNNIEPPVVSVDRDFDLQTLDGAQVGQYLQLWQNGAICHETLLAALVKGEILPGLDVELELEMVQTEKLDNMAMAMPIGNPEAPSNNEEDENAEPAAEQSSLRAEMEARIRQMAGDNDEDES